MAYIDLLGHQRALNSQRGQDYFRAIDTARAVADSETRDFENDRNFQRGVGLDSLNASRAFFNDEVQRENSDRSAELSRDYLDYYKSQTPRGELQQQRDLLALAEQDANEGLFEPEKYAGALTPVQIQVLSRRNAAARIGLTDEYNYFKNVSDTRNRAAGMAADVAGLKTMQQAAPGEAGFIKRGINAALTLGNIPFRESLYLGPDANTPTRESIQENIDFFTGEQAQLKPALDRFAADKKNESGVTFDESTGQYRPTRRLVWMGDEKAAPRAVPTPQRQTITKFHPRTGQPILYDAVTKQAIGYGQ